MTKKQKSRIEGTNLSELKKVAKSAKDIRKLLHLAFTKGQFEAEVTSETTGHIDEETAEVIKTEVVEESDVGGETHDC